MTRPCIVNRRAIIGRSTEVDHQHIKVQRVARMVAHFLAAGLRAQ